MPLYTSILDLVYTDMEGIWDQNTTHSAMTVSIIQLKGKNMDKEREGTYSSRYIIVGA